MKRIKFVLLYTLLGIGVVFMNQTAAHARLDPSLGLYMTEENSMSSKSIFGLDEKPFAFLQFHLDDLDLGSPLTIRWVWRFEGDRIAKEYEKITNFGGDPLDLWNSLDNWDLHKRTGEWSVRAKWRNGIGDEKGKDLVNFTVTPEPVSSLLFLLGGAGLAVTGYRKRKMQA